MKYINFLLVFAVLTGCSLSNDPEVVLVEDNLIIDNSPELSGVSRLNAVNKSIEINFLNTSGRQDLVLEQMYALSPPVVEGTTIQATSVTWKSNRVMVSYNVKGETYKGAIDYLTFDDNELMLEAQITHNNADIHYVEYFGSTLYLGAARAAVDSQAFVHRIEVKGRDLRDNGVTAKLGSYAVTSIERNGNSVYVTTGADENLGGGVYKLDADLVLASYIPLHDARWVYESDKTLYIAQGTPGAISIIDEQNFVLKNTFSVPGAFELEAKTTVDVEDGLIFFAGGAEGVFVYDETTNVQIANITFDDELSITNAVAVDDGKIFVSNGEAGIFIVSFDYKGKKFGSEVIGSFNFGDGFSANHIDFDDNVLIVASGLGGVRVVQTN